MAGKALSNLLPPQSVRPFVNEAAKAFSIVEARRLSTSPLPEIRKVITTRKLSLGGPLTRPECDKVMEKLALALPRAGITPAQAHATMDLYFNLLSRAGVTGRMLISAAERYIMAPNGVKGKFFPDPGQLAELCAEDMRARARDMEGLDKALALLDAPPAAEEPNDPAARRAQLHAVAQDLEALKPPPPKLPSTARPETPDSLKELRETAERRLKGKTA